MRLCYLCQTGHVSSDVSPSENHREERHSSKPSSTTSVRHRSKTHTQLIKEKLDQIKAEMQKISKAHLHQRPERKAYHPFVWNALSPYRETTEIDHLLTTITGPDRRNRCSSVKPESSQLSKWHFPLNGCICLNMPQTRNHLFFHDNTHI